VAGRRLSKNLGFTIVVALTLGLAIGGNAAIYSVVSGVLLKPLPYPEPDRLVRVFAQHPRFATLPLSPSDFHALREDTEKWATRATYVDPVQYASTAIAAARSRLSAVRTRHRPPRC
jgi:hypothetical protein